jgi:hypothetical protein
MSKVYVDSETCGLHSMMVLLQCAEEDGPIHLYDVWKRPVYETLRLIEWLCENTIVGFNLAFDWFQIIKVYTTFRLADPDWIPEEHIDEIAMLEPQAQEGPCVKPANALDLLLHSRKGPYQSLMAREDIRIRRVPTALAYALAEELEQRVQLDGIYFARSADKDAPRWKVFDVKDRDGEIDEHFKDVVLKFNPAGGLKFLAEYAMGFKPKYHYKDVEPDPEWFPRELGYALIALALSSPDENWEVYETDKKTGEPVLTGYAWPGVIQKFIDHWATNEPAREYARDDIVYTRALDEHFGYPEPGDDDSVLACMVPVVRWRGFKIDIPGIRELLAKAQDVVARSPVNVNKPSEVRAYLGKCMDEMEKVAIEETTKKAKLEAVSKWHLTEDEECSKCLGEDQGCWRCSGTGMLSSAGDITDRCGNHPAAARAREILDVKTAVKEIELYSKLLVAGKFHASFNVVGTLSSRMSGGDGLNAQGIKKTKEVRRMFPLAWDGYELCGGDFDSFEVTLADAVYDDKTLRADLLSGKKIHALFAMALFPGKTYDEVIASDGSAFDMYHKGKTAVFRMIYGGGWEGLADALGISEDAARGAFESFGQRYKGVEKARGKTFDAFCSMRQPGGVGSAVIWHEPAEYVESFLKFRRYFTLENTIAKALFDLARSVPAAWRKTDIKVMRRPGRIQTAGGAVSSALYGAAFGIQAANMRAAANHEIQSPGGQITKAVQRRIWDLQPAGVHDLLVAPMNIHDEIMCVTHPATVKEVTEQVRDTVESFRLQVPLIGMSWFESMENWAEKKTGAEKVKIRCPEMMEF